MDTVSICLLCQSLGDAILSLFWLIEPAQNCISTRGEAVKSSYGALVCMQVELIVLHSPWLSSSRSQAANNAIEQAYISQSDCSLSSCRRLVGSCVIARKCCGGAAWLLLGEERLPWGSGCGPCGGHRNIGCESAQLVSTEMPCAQGRNLG